VAQRFLVFQHLTHADSSITPKHGGTGLGLTTCSQLLVARQHLRSRPPLRPGQGQAKLPVRSDLTPVLSAGADGARLAGLDGYGGGW
jgi:hypothetical protein